MCEDSSVDSIWLSERLVSPQPFLEPLSALAAIGGPHAAPQVRHERDRPAPARPAGAGEGVRHDRLPQRRPLPAHVRRRQRRGAGVAGAGPRHARPRQRSNEMLKLLTRLWTEDHVSFDGKYYHYDGRHDQPRSPCRRRCPCGSAAAATRPIERTARYGTGWLRRRHAAAGADRARDQRHHASARPSSDGRSTTTTTARASASASAAGTSRWCSALCRPCAPGPARTPTRAPSWPSAAPTRSSTSCACSAPSASRSSCCAPSRRTTTTCWSRPRLVDAEVLPTVHRFA